MWRAVATICVAARGVGHILLASLDMDADLGIMRKTALGCDQAQTFDRSDPVDRDKYLT
jgi:hypothetical protein